MSKFAPIALCCVLLAGCSGPSRKTTVYPTGDKAPVDKMVYSVVDTQILPRLGEDASIRIPQNRFYVVQLSVSNSGNEDSPIPAMTLIDDSGKTYDELTDGAGVNRWLGVVRHVGANQSETGAIVFDAPASHYKLKLTDETDANDVYIDIPLSFAHEQMTRGAEDVSDAAAVAPVTGVDPAAKPGAAKKK
jgi:hypothetical protein